MPLWERGETGENSDQNRYHHYHQMISWSPPSLDDYHHNRMSNFMNRSSLDYLHHDYMIILTIRLWSYHDQVRRKRRGAAKNETRTTNEDNQEGKLTEVFKLEEDESVLLARVKRQLVGSERYNNDDENKDEEKDEDDDEGCAVALHHQRLLLRCQFSPR